MTKHIFLLSFILLFMSCDGRKNNNITEFEAIVNQLRQDENHLFLKTLRGFD